MPFAGGIQGNSFFAAYNVFFRGTQPLTAYDFFSQNFSGPARGALGKFLSLGLYMACRKALRRERTKQAEENA